MNKLFYNVGSVIPARSEFNLSYEKKFTCDMGELIPVMCDECVPGDVFNIGNQMILRFTPLVAPMLHEVNVFVHYFFVPYRLLWDDWEDFITGGPDGDLVPTLPRWNPTSGQNDVGTLWDYLGFPIDVDPDGAYPMDFPRQAYYFIYNEYYRDQTLIDPVDWWTDTSEYTIQLRAWEKDYFTSSQLTRQRGTSPALPLVGTDVTSAVWDTAYIGEQLGALSGNNPPLRVHGLNTTSHPMEIGFIDSEYTASAKTNLLNALNNNEVTVDFSLATPFDIADIREAFQIQRFLERNQRAGARYTEFLRAHFSCNPRDDRLDRPEYIGGNKCPVIISEVLQTADTTNGKVGEMKGHGISINQEYIGKYRVEEFGLIMGIMSIMPKPAYSQGINRQWLRETKYDFYFPEFAHLSEQVITTAEIYATDVSATNLTPFGYCGAYDELRVKQNMVCGLFRDTFNYWHLSREFGSAPTLSQTFIECVPRKDPFAYQSDDVVMVQFGNIIKAYRPLPIIAEPGLVDH